MAWLWHARVGLLAAVLLFSIIDLGLCAGLIAKLHNFNGRIDYSAPTYAQLGIAVSVLSLISLGPMLVIDFIRRGALTSWILVELVVTGLLWILWVAAAAQTASITDGESVDCSLDIGDGKSTCQMYQGIEAFSFINWIILIVYFVALLVMAIIAHVRGAPVWRSSVHEADFSKRADNNGVPMTQTHAGMYQGPPHPQGATV